MTIEWLADERIIPRIGVFQFGDIRDVPDDVGEALVKQGMAKETIEEEYDVRESD